MMRVRLDSEERRRAIVQAAMPLFARGGFAGTTTKSIARAAGVSEALVFQHFPSKLALYQEIVRQCEGDPALERLLALEPSAQTAVHMTAAMLEHFVCGTLGDPAETELDHRMTMMSYLDDGEYARLQNGWCAERVLPLLHASLKAAAAAGELVEGAPFSRNDAWFGHHVATMIAYTRLSGTPAVPYESDLVHIVDDASRFILRGLGLSAASIERHLKHYRLSSRPEPAAA